MLRRTDLHRHKLNIASTVWSLSAPGIAGCLHRHVTILRTGDEFGYTFAPPDMRSTFDVFSTTVPLKRLHEGGVTPAEAELTESRVDYLVRLVPEYEICILSAIGCGTFSRDPEEIATLFRKAIARYKKGRFLFALRSTDSDRKRAGEQLSRHA